MPLLRSVGIDLHKPNPTHLLYHKYKLKSIANMFQMSACLSCVAGSLHCFHSSDILDYVICKSIMTQIQCAAPSTRIFFFFFFFFFCDRLVRKQSILVCATRLGVYRVFGVCSLFTLWQSPAGTQTVWRWSYSLLKHRLLGESKGENKRKASTTSQLYRHLGGDKVSMLTHTYPHKPLRKIEVTIRNHQVDSPLSNLVICRFRKGMMYMTPNVLTETRCH